MILFGKGPFVENAKFIYNLYLKNILDVSLLEAENFIPHEYLLLLVVECKTFKEF